MIDPHLVEIILERLDQCASQIISPKPDAVFSAAAQVIREMRDEISRLDRILANVPVRCVIEANYAAGYPRCEHGISEGDWCEPCNKEYKRAAKAAGFGD